MTDATIRTSWDAFVAACARVITERLPVMDRHEGAMAALCPLFGGSCVDSVVRDCRIRPLIKPTCSFDRSGSIGCSDRVVAHDPIGALGADRNMSGRGTPPV